MRTPPPTAPRASARPARPARNGAPRVPFALLVVGLVVGCLCALLALNTASAADELSRHNLAVKDASIAAQVQQLQNEVAASAAPGSLGQAAAALGMVPAAGPAFLQVGADGKIRLLGSPAAATRPPVPAPVAQTKPPASTAAASATATDATPPKATPTKTGAPTTGAGTTTHPANPTAPSPHLPTPTPTPAPTTTLPGGAR